MTNPSFLLETPRLFLSHLQGDSDQHCDFMVELYNSPEFIASIGGKPTSIVTREAARRLLTNAFPAHHVRNGYGTYLVSLKPAEYSVETPEDIVAALQAATPIGTVSLMRGEEPDCYAAPDLGFAVLPAHMRRGYTKEACQALLEYVAREKGVQGAFGFFNPDNAASRAVFRSLGFEDRGLHPLRIFGNEVSAVWTAPGMEADLSVYGL